MNKYNHWIVKGIGLIGLGIMVWMTWYFGYTYVKLVTQSKHPTQSSQLLVAQNPIEIKLDPILFWTCQTGVFNSEENAQREKEHLQQLGWEAQIITKNPWIVSIGFAYSKEEVLPIYELLKEGGIASVPKSIIGPERAFRIKGNGAKETADILKEVNAFLKNSEQVRTSRLPQFENVMLLAPSGLRKLQEVSLLIITAERNMQVDQKIFKSLELYSEYLKTLEALQR